MTPFELATTFEYNHPTVSNRVTGIQRPYARHATLTYTADHLTGITDMQGLVSSLMYANGSDLVTSMTTPYGQTSFDSVDRAWGDNVAVRSILVTNPDNSQERYAFYDSATGLVPSGDYTAIPNVSGVGPTLDTGTVSERDSFRWTSLNLSHITGTWPSYTANDLRKARMTHWLAASTLEEVGWDPSMMRDPSPDDDGNAVGQCTYYSYPGMADGIVGASDLPNLVAELAPPPLSQESYDGEDQVKGPVRGEVFPNQAG